MVVLRLLTISCCCCWRKRPFQSYNKHIITYLNLKLYIFYGYLLIEFHFCPLLNRWSHQLYRRRRRPRSRDQHVLLDHVHIYPPSSGAQTCGLPCHPSRCGELCGGRGWEEVSHLLPVGPVHAVLPGMWKCVRERGHCLSQVVIIMLTETVGKWWKCLR